MRYLKVLLSVVFFFLVMLFFVQNQPFLSQSMPLKFELMFMPPIETPPMPFYSLGLICFLLGGVCTLCMLILDRLTIGSHLRAGRRRLRGMEKELARASSALETLKNELDEAKAKEEAAAGEAQRALGEAQLAKSEAQLAKDEARRGGPVSFSDDLRQE